jgi:hypothetical protein
MKISLGIKDKHIQYGEKANPQNCAIARAIKEKMHNIDKVGVFPGHVYLVTRNKKTNKTSAYKAKLSKKVDEFIKRFDDGKPVNSFVLSLDLKHIGKFAKEIA